MIEEYKDNIIESIREDLSLLLESYGKCFDSDLDLYIKYIKIEMLFVISRYKSEKLIYDFNFNFTYNNDKIVILIYFSFGPCIYEGQRYIDISLSVNKI